MVTKIRKSRQFLCDDIRKKGQSKRLAERTKRVKKDKANKTWHRYSYLK